MENEEKKPEGSAAGADDRNEDAAAGVSPPEGSAPQAEPSAEAAQIRQQLQEALKSAGTYKDLLLRKAAEFENYKRRTEADFGALTRSANEGLLLSLLPILNDFLRSLKAGSEQKDYEAFYKGVELICNKFSKVLEARGVVPFESLGKPFDVEYHDALLQVPSPDAPPHTVVQEVERGYMLHDKVLRHAKVIVSSGEDVAGEIPPRVPESIANEGESEKPKKK